MTRCTAAPFLHLPFTQRLLLVPPPNKRPCHRLTSSYILPTVSCTFQDPTQPKVLPDLPMTLHPKHATPIRHRYILLSTQTHTQYLDSQGRHGRRSHAHDHRPNEKMTTTQPAATKNGCMHRCIHEKKRKSIWRSRCPSPIDLSSNLATPTSPRDGQANTKRTRITQASGPKKQN